MAGKKKEKPEKPEKSESPRTITIERTVQVYVGEKPKHEKRLPAGMTLSIVEDGVGLPVDDVSKTIWHTYAELITSARGADKVGYS